MLSQWWSRIMCILFSTCIFIKAITGFSTEPSHLYWVHDNFKHQTLLLHTSWPYLESQAQQTPLTQPLRVCFSVWSAARCTCRTSYVDETPDTPVRVPQSCWMNETQVAALVLWVWIQLCGIAARYAEAWHSVLLWTRELWELVAHFNRNHNDTTHSL